MSKIKSVLSRAPKPALETFQPETVISPESFDESPLGFEDSEIDPRDEIDTAMDPVDADIAGLYSLTDQTNKYQAVYDAIAPEIHSGKGLSVEAATILNIYSFNDGLDIVRARVSNESNTHISLEESKVALEGIKEVLREWWQKFTAFLKDARSRFSHWLDNAFNGADQLKELAERLKEEITNAQPGSGNIEFSDKGKLLIDNGWPNVANEMNRLGRIADMVLNKTIENTYENAERVASAIAQYQPGGEGSFNSLLQALSEGVAHPADAIAGELNQRLTEDVTEILLKGDDSINASVEASEPFLGNGRLVAIVVTVNPSENPVQGLVALSKAYKFSKILVVDTSAENKLWNSRNHQVEDKEVPRCSPTDVARIADGAISVANAMLKLKGSGNLKSQIDRAVDQAGQNIANMNINENVESGGSIASALRSIVSSVASMPSGVTSNLVSFFGTTSRSALKYGKECLTSDKQEETENNSNKPNQPN